MGSKTVAGLIPEFLSYKTCADAPPSFSGCMSNVTADLGERVVLNCQVDPRCVIQYLHWYHEPMVGDKRLLKTGKSSNDPYVQTINRVEEHNFGRYICVIANVAGETECSATMKTIAGFPREWKTSYKHQDSTKYRNGSLPHINELEINIEEIDSAQISRAVHAIQSQATINDEEPPGYPGFLKVNEAKPVLSLAKSDIGGSVFELGDDARKRLQNRGNSVSMKKKSFGNKGCLRLTEAGKGLSSAMSVVYAMFLVTLCMVFTTTELVSDQIPMNYFESCGFYTYLYAVSNSFILYLFTYVLRARFSGSPGKALDFDAEQFIQSLFLRLGAIVFGLGTLIYTGLEFLVFFEVPSSCPSWSVLLGINPILYMVFVFIQMYFVFMHARLNINRNKIVAKFGMMHLVATNTCMVIRTLVKESVKELQYRVESEHEKLDWSKMFRNQDCLKEQIIGDTMENSSVYLFPFMIEYSFIGCSVVYSMWSHIGENPDYVVLDDNSGAQPISGQRHVREPLDWSASSVGLFLGLLALVTLIISMILHFALIDQHDYTTLAITIDSSIDSVINVCMIVGSLVGFLQIQNLVLINSHHVQADKIMIITGFGISLYNTFTSLAGLLNTSQQVLEDPAFVITNGFLELIQVCVQILFITDLRHRRIDVTQTSRPGRQVVTFLTICNLGMWITSNFEIQKVNSKPDQVEFYGFFPWIVIQRITLPLCVFFRFHSCVVLAELWKNCYRIKREERISTNSTASVISGGSTQ
eukprot:TCALIF_10106-PA protein Name:"Similar to Otop2 Otopetrin-2 (Mus musculus)" AED:0.10 eAED:0.10 QI:20/0.5/0.22/1/0.37/0.22/9/0/754